MKLLPLICQLKITTKTRGTVKFGLVMNAAQRDLIMECERQLTAYGRIRIIVLKARQIGMSTAIEAVIFVLTLMNDHFQSLIVSHEKDSAAHLLNMTRTYWDTYIFNDMHEEKYNGRTHLSWGDMDSGVQIITAKNEKGGRSRTIHALHASEVGFWDNAPTLMPSLNNAIPSSGLTAVFLESTANGVGNYFHEMWLGGVKGDNEYTPRFYPWYRHPEYKITNLPIDAREKYSHLGELNEEENILREMGLGPDRLLWRRWCIANNCQGSTDVFHQEYPTTASEAFLSTGTNVFKLPLLARHYQPVTNSRRGRLISVGNTVKFVEAVDGELTVFRNPSKTQDYIIAGDATWTLEGDYACAQILNRRTLEQVAVYRKKIDPVHFATDLYLLGVHWNTALVAPEREGPGYATIGALLALSYPNVYRGPKLDHTPGKLVGDQYGWGTNKQTKPLAISHVVNVLSQPLEHVGQVTYGLLLHDPVTFDELQNYVTDGRGGYCNSDGSDHDDTVMALGIAVAVNQIMPPPMDIPDAKRDTRPVPTLARQPSVGELVAAANGTGRMTALIEKPAPEREVEAMAWDDWDGDN